MTWVRVADQVGGGSTAALSEHIVIFSETEETRDKIFSFNTDIKERQRLEVFSMRIELMTGSMGGSRTIVLELLSSFDDVISKFEFEPTFSMPSSFNEWEGTSGQTLPEHFFILRDMSLRIIEAEDRSSEDRMVVHILGRLS